MLLVERVIHRRIAQDSHSHMPLPTTSLNETSQSNGRVEFDVELSNIENEEGLANGAASGAPHFGEEPVDKARVYPLTLGLVVHALADGFALGSSATSPIDRGLSVTVFLALIIHKGWYTCAICCGTHQLRPSAPTVLALTTSLLATGLPKSSCRKHVAVFSASTPIGALLVYFLLSLVRVNSESPWTGITMLISVSYSPQFNDLYCLDVVVDIMYRAEHFYTLPPYCSLAKLHQKNWTKKFGWHWLSVVFSFRCS